MIWHLVALAICGLGSAGVALLLRKVTRQKLPRWLVPVFAGAGMLAYQIHFEYSWFDHKQSQLPPGSVVVSSESGTVFWRPWTFYFPMTTEFSVIDVANLRFSETAGDRIAQFVQYQFEKQYIDVVTYHTYLLNCDTADLIPLTSEGIPNVGRMQNIARDGQRYTTVCNL
ncbi:hypothetical protein NFC81_14615 [Salinispirillum sp. LH 10-3-1]|uniref:Uncharacterized protein n=1 Tax=Salinispirillum sp. LH 10-3-1 TaxID=2952525 RepID=A0AB38YFH9_9GAMM